MGRDPGLAADEEEGAGRGLVLARDPGVKVAEVDVGGLDEVVSSRDEGALQGLEPAAGSSRSGSSMDRPTVSAIGVLRETSAAPSY